MSSFISDGNGGVNPIFIVVVTVPVVVLIILMVLFYLRRRRTVLSRRSTAASEKPLATLPSGYLNQSPFGSNAPLRKSISSSTHSQPPSREQSQHQIKKSMSFSSNAVPTFLEFSSRDYKLEKQIYKSDTKQIFIAEAINSNLKRFDSKVVIKALGNGDQVPLELLSEAQRTSFLNEVSLMWKFVDEMEFATILGFNPKTSSIIMKFYPHGSLSGFIFDSEANLTKRRAVKFLHDVARGLYQLHIAGLVKGLVNPESILIDEDERGELMAVLTDFSMSQALPDKIVITKESVAQVSNSRSLNFVYTAPELLTRITKDITVSQDYVQACDLYGFAITIYELLLRQLPYGEIDPSLMALHASRRPSESSVTSSSLHRSLSRFRNSVSN